MILNRSALMYISNYTTIVPKSYNAFVMTTFGHEYCINCVFLPCTCTHIQIGYQPVHIAAMNGHVELVEYLVSENHGLLDVAVVVRACVCQYCIATGCCDRTVQYQFILQAFKVTLPCLKF